MHGYGDNRGSCAHYLGNLLCCGQNDPLSHMFFFKWYYTDTEIYDVERKSSARIGHMEFNFHIIALRK